jgi:glycosyltransferase involved in cell wall biosynthesis
MSDRVANPDPGHHSQATAPRVSIVIPTYRRPALLAEAVASALGQTGFHDYEVLVLDNDADAPTPNSAEEMVARYGDPRLRYLRNAQNLGMTGNWNRGLEVARGAWMTLLHDDDLLCPAFLERMAPLFDESDLVACKVVVGSLHPGGSDGNWPPPRAQARRIKAADLVFSNVSPAPGVIFRRSEALLLGGFRDEWYPCADYDFWIRYVLRHRAWMLPEPLAFYRVQDNESLQVSTRIRIAERAVLLQRDLVERLIPGSPWIPFIAGTGVQSLLHHYCKDRTFRESRELADFSNQVGFRPWAPKWWIKTRASLAKRLLRWASERVAA